MQLDRPLRLITPTVDGDVLAVLAVADAAFTVPTVHRLVGRHSEAGVRKALHRLEQQGIVTSERAGRVGLYRFNRDHLGAGAIIELARLSETFLERMRSVIAGWDVQPELVMLFGSAARGDMDVDSDIDIFVVRPDEGVDDDQWRLQVDELARTATGWTGNDTRVLDYRRSDLSRGPDPVLDNIRRDGIHVAGDRAVFHPVAMEVS